MLRVEAMLDWICAYMPGTGKAHGVARKLRVELHMRGRWRDLHVHAGGADDGAAGLALGIIEPAAEPGAQHVHIAERDGRSGLQAGERRGLGREAARDLRCLPRSPAAAASHRRRRAHPARPAHRCGWHIGRR